MKPRRHFSVVLITQNWWRTVFWVFIPPNLDDLERLSLKGNIHQQLVLLEQWVEWQHVIVLGGLLSVTPLFSGQCHRGDWRCAAREWCWLWKFEHTFQKTGIRRYPKYHTYSRYAEIMNRFTFQNCCFRRGRERILMNIWKWHMYDFLLGNLSNRADTSSGGSVKEFLKYEFQFGSDFRGDNHHKSQFGSRIFFNHPSEYLHSGFHDVIQSYDGSPTCR